MPASLEAPPPSTVDHGPRPDTCPSCKNALDRKRVHPKHGWNCTACTKTLEAADRLLTAAPVKQITLRPLQTRKIIVPIRGLTPYIAHKWPEKALRLMRDKQMNPGVRTTQREAKDPVSEAEASTYYLDEEGTQPGIPAVAFKAALVASCRLFDGFPMTEAKMLLFVEGQGKDNLVPIEGVKERREDTPRNATGVVDLRYRNQFMPWSTTLTIVYPETRISGESVLALVDAAGRYAGVGDWRPSAPKSHTGTYGTWEIDPDKAIDSDDMTFEDSGTGGEES